MSLLNCINVSKYYGNKKVLDNVSFTLDSGEIVGFIGKNGAGKSTMMKLILGLNKCSSGDIFIDDCSINTDYIGAINNVGALIEGPSLYTYLTGRDNLLMLGRLYGTSLSQIEHVIKLSGLNDRIDDKVAKYSLGMKERLGIACAILNKPKLLILDEPTNGLDVEGINELKELIKYLAFNKNMGILISSHNLKELDDLVTKALIIKEGKIILNKKINNINKNLNIYNIRLNTTEGINTILHKKDKIIDKYNISVYSNEKNIPLIINKLLSNNYLIYEINKLNKTLEDIYLSKELNHE